jgi:hypothetical protein
MPPLNSADNNKVLKIYTTAMKTSLNEHQEAFDGRLVPTALATRMCPRRWPAARWRGSFAITCRDYCVTP